MNNGPATQRIENPLADPIRERLLVNLAAATSSIAWTASATSGGSALDAVIRHGVVDARLLTEELDESASGATTAIERLVEIGALTQIGSGAATADSRHPPSSRRSTSTPARSPAAPNRLSALSRTVLAVAGVIESGSVTALIDRTHPLVEIAAPIRRFQGGHTRGKIVITF